MYLKFPSSHAVLRQKHSSDIIAGKVTHDNKKLYFATCWDCRGYSCLKPNYIRTRDSQETMDCLVKYCETDSLVTKIDRTKLPWSSTLHVVDKMDVCKYCQPATIGNLFPFIEHSVYGISHKAQNWMFTLPDVFKDEQTDGDELRVCQIPKIAEWNNEKFIDKLELLYEEVNEETELDNDKLFKLWNKLRNSSKYIATQTEAVNKHGVETKTVRHVVSLGDVSFDEPFKHIISTIRRRILPKPNT